MPEDIDIARAGEIRDEILDEAPDIEGLRIEMGGFVFAEFEQPSSEALGIAFAIVILILAFGSVLAMGLPVGVALFGIGIGTSLIVGLSHLFTVPETAPVHRPHDRPRRRHRLRAADRHPLPRAAARGPHGARVGRHRHGHRGSLGPVRRHHRGHLVARPAHRQGGVRERPRPGRRPGRRHHVGGVADAAAGAARLRRQAGSSAPAGAGSIAAGFAAIGLLGAGPGRRAAGRSRLRRWR